MKTFITVLILLIISFVIFIFWEKIAPKTGLNINLPNKNNVKTQATPSSLRFKTPFDSYEGSENEQYMKKKESFFKQEKKW